MAAKHDVRIHVHGGFGRAAQAARPARRRSCSSWSSAAAPISARTIGWRDTGGVCDGNNIAACGVPVVDTMGARGGAIHSDAGISDRREPGRARATVGADHPAARQGGGFVSFRVRPARNEDFQAIYEMAKLTGGGFTNLPADKGALVAKLARSERRLRARRRAIPDGDLFVFVLENAETGRDPRHLPGVQPGRHRSAFLFLPDQHADPDLARARPDLPRRDADPVHRFRGLLRGRRPVPPPERARRRPRRAARAQPLSVHQAAPRALRRPRCSPSCAA